MKQYNEEHEKKIGKTRQKPFGKQTNKHSSKDEKPIGSYPFHEWNTQIVLKLVAF